jgi:hypothetical protein
MQKKRVENRQRTKKNLIGINVNEYVQVCNRKWETNINM